MGDAVLVPQRTSGGTLSDSYRSLALDGFQLMASALGSNLDDSLLASASSMATKGILSALLESFTAIDGGSEPSLTDVSDVFDSIQFVLEKADAMDALEELNNLRLKVDDVTEALVAAEREVREEQNREAEPESSPFEEPSDFDESGVGDEPDLGFSAPFDFENGYEPDAEPSAASDLPFEPLNDLVVDFDHLPFLSYAMAHNQIGVFTEVRILNAGIERGPLKLHLDALSGDTVLGSLTTESFFMGDGQGIRMERPEISLPLNSNVMRQIATTMPGIIRARVEWKGKIVAKREVEIQVLSATRWAVSPPIDISLQLLAAYVLPHEPVIQNILKEASDVLKGWNVDSSIGGYQGPPEIVDLEVKAIAQAIRNRDLTYTNPPASWKLTVDGNVVAGGQSVRTPTEVLDGTGGTCLDTSLVLAAALEQAGINPTLWLIEGHAFVGYWRSEARFPSPATFDPGNANTIIKSGAGMAFVETTKLTRGGEDATWEEIQGEPLGLRMKGDWSNFQAVVDVAAARRDRILPLDAREIDTSGNVTIITYDPKFTGGTPRTYEGVERTRPDAPGETPERVVKWKNALLDLTAKNALIRFRPRSSVKLEVPSDKVALFEDMVNAGTAITLAKSDGISPIMKERGLKAGDELPSDVLAGLMESQGLVFTNQAEGAYDRILRNLQLSAKNYRQETGANNLYLSFGMLNWSSGPQQFSSPLVLVPIKLESIIKKGDYRITLDDAGESAPNFCLLEKLSRELKIEIPGLRNPVTDDSGIDIEAAFTAVAKAIEESKQGFTMDRSVHLATLQFAKYRIWKDLDENWHNFTENTLVKHLTYSHMEPFNESVVEHAEEDLEELITKVPLPADGSQLTAVQKAVNGNTFVLEGPPGTGKSQAITNMLARLITEGKKVLFVAEKAEALRVVRRRLDEAGLGVMSLDAHDKGAKPAAIKAQLKAALDLVAEYDEGQFGAATQAVTASRSALVRYRDRLASRNGAGFALYDAVAKSLEDRSVAPLPLTQSFVEGCTPEEVQSIRVAIESMVGAVGPARPSAHHPWRPVTDHTVDIDEVISAAESLTQAVNALLAIPAGASLASNVRDQAEAEALLGILTGPRISAADARHGTSNEWNARASDFETKVKQFVAVPRPIFLTLDPGVLSLELEQIARSAAETEKLRFSAKRDMREALMAQFIPFVRPGKKLKDKSIAEACAILIAIKGDIADLVGQSQQLPGLQLPSTFNPFDEESLSIFEYRREWITWAAGFLANDGNFFRDEFVTLVSGLMDSSASNSDVADAWTAYEGALRTFTEAARIDAEELSSWAASEGVALTWKSTSANRGQSSEELRRSLTNWLNFVAPSAVMTDLGLVETRRKLLDGTIHPDEADEALEVGLATVSIGERMYTTGLLDFDGSAHERQIVRYRGGITKIRQQLPGMLPQQIASKRGFNASATSGRIGQLRLQLNKERGGLTVRGIFKEFGEIITAITPCIMMSPESVARLIPAKPGLFDVVVFDEASQLRVADSIGAMGRGKSVVVVGDSKQMPPTSFFDSAGPASELGDAEAESLDELMDVPEDQESILTECKQALVPTDSLTWHYRSQDESLISFSNTEYYDDKLASFPTPNFGTRDDGVNGYGISFRHIKVPGLPAKERTPAALAAEKKARQAINQKVAEEIVAEVVRRFKAADADVVPSIGIVTFSVEETKLIDALLRGTNDKIRAALEDDEGIFVKSIEFVQGDERDTIMFFVSKPVQGGEVSLVGYGSLAKQGGERRLNVAITRARRQVIVFSSFLPNQLPFTRATNPGVRHFGRYLELAQSGSDKAMSDPYRVPVRDRHRNQIADKLRERGYGVTTDVGLSDFRVDIAVSPKATKGAAPVAAVLLDGNKWTSRLTVADRDALPAEVLSNLMKWPTVQRVWLADWLKDPEAAIDRLCAEIDGVAAGRTASEVTAFPEDGFDLSESAVKQTISTPEGSGSSASATSSASLTDLPEFVAWQATETHTRDFLNYLPHNAQAVAGVQEIIRHIVNAEGPIHEVRLAKLVAAHCSLTRVSADRQRAILDQIPRDLGRPTDEPFVWPSHLDPETWTAFRVNTAASARTVDEISWRELSNAMAHLTSENLGMTGDELKRATLNLFLGTRLTQSITAKLDETLDKALKAGRLTKSDSGFIEPGN